MLERSFVVLDGMIEELEAALGVSSKAGETVKDDKKKKTEKEPVKQPEKANDDKKSEKGKENKNSEGKGGDKKNKTDKPGKEPKAAGDAKPAPASEGEQPEFTKLELKVGVLTKTWFHPESEKLYCEEIDVGEMDAFLILRFRTGGSTSGCFRTQASFLPRRILYLALDKQPCGASDKIPTGPGRKVVVVTNLKAAKMAGFESQGMVMASTSADGKVELLDPPQDAKVGERIYIEGVQGEPFNPNQVQKKKTVLPDLQTNNDCIACWQVRRLGVVFRCNNDSDSYHQGKPFMTSAGPIKVTWTHQAD
eukprot:751992-Hanusia_phi.AAC.1